MNSVASRLRAVAVAVVTATVAATEIVVAAVDPSGNKTERREKVNVEVY